MEQNAPFKPVVSRRRYPLWRGLLCLLLGGIAWWAVAHCLKPQPLWTKTISAEDTCYYPLAEDKEGKYLVAWEYQPAPGPVKKAEPTLAVLDSMTGKILYSVPRRDVERPTDVNLPHFVDKTIWRIKETTTEFHRTFELRAWNYLKETKETIVHQWRLPFSNLFHLRVDWPDDSPVLLFRYRVDLLLLLGAIEPNPWIKLLILRVQSDNDFELSWYESWQLPTNDSEQFRMLSRWTVPWSRWSEVAKCSPDGRVAAVPETSLSGLQLVRNFQSKPELQGQELLKAFSHPPYGTLLFDTRTGKQLGTIETAFTFHFQVSWHERNIIIEGQTIDPKKKLTSVQINELKDKGILWHTDETFTLLEPRNGHWESVAWRDPPGVKLIQLQSLNSELIGVERLNDNQCRLNLLDFANHQLRVRKVIEGTADYFGLEQVWLSPKATQLVNAYRKEHWLYSQLSEWANKWRWLEHVLSFFPSAPPYQIIVHDTTGDSNNSLTLARYCCNFSSPQLKNLYLIQYRPDDLGYEIPTLEAYAMPLKLYSPWWSRLACLVVTVFAWLLLTYRCRLHRSAPIR